MIEIAADKVSFSYKTSELKVLKEIDLQIQKGKFIVICGPTGSGKTSLIRAMNGLIPHFWRGKFYGFMYVKEIDTCSSSPAFLSKEVGTVFQNPENQLFSMDVERELAFSLENLGFPPDSIKKKIEEVISITKIENLRHRPPFQLSGGEQQKVAIASLLALDPDILILDEPLSNLDPKTAQDIIKLLKTLQKTHGKTIIISEHRLNYIISVSDEIIVINDGKIIQHDDTQVVFDSDFIYNLGLDLPPMIYWLKKKHQEGLFSGQIPLNIQDQTKVLSKIFSKYKKIPEKVLKSEIHKKYSIGNKPPIAMLKNVSYSYDSLKDQTPTLNNISLSIFPGEILAIMGANGAGKSTLIKCISGLIKPNNGTISILGRNTKNIPAYKIAKDVGLMFQNPDHQLFLNSILDEIKFSLKNLNLSEEEEKLRIQIILEQLDLTDLVNNSPFDLSGGQRKKVSLATILCRQPKIIIFDEPTIGADAVQKRRLNKIIRQAQKQNQTVIIVSHDLEFVANLATRLVILDKGKIFTEGSIEEIFIRSQILERISLSKYGFNELFRNLNKEFSWIPKNILKIDQLEDLIEKCL